MFLLFSLFPRQALGPRSAYVGSTSQDKEAYVRATRKRSVLLLIWIMQPGNTAVLFVPRYSRGTGGLRGDLELVLTIVDSHMNNRSDYESKTRGLCKPFHCMLWSNNALLQVKKQQIAICLMSFLTGLTVNDNKVCAVVLVKYRYI